MVTSAIIDGEYVNCRVITGLQNITTNNCENVEHSTLYKWDGISLGVAGVRHTLPQDVDGVVPNLKGMLSLAEDPGNASEDWGILKDFLGFRLPQESDCETGEINLRSRPPSTISPTLSSQCCNNTNHIEPPVILNRSIQVPIPTLSVLETSTAEVSLPSITTLVRAVSCSADNSSCGIESLESGSSNSIARISSPVDLSSIKTDYCKQSDQSVCFQNANSSVIVEPNVTNQLDSSHTSTQASLAIECSDRSNVTSELDASENKSSASLLRDLLVLGKTPRVNPCSEQGRLGGLVRSGSMEQRWQDLASLLSLPSPDAQHGQSPTPSMASHGTSPIHTHSHSHLPQPIHHPHALYANHESPAASGQQAGVSRGVLLHNTNLPLPMSDHSAHNITYSNSMGASSHLVASSMNLANNSDMAVDHHYKMETNNMTADMMYYQQQQQQQQQHQHNSTPEITQSNDGIWSSILNEEELQLMDIGMNDYNGRGNGEYGANNYRYNAAEDPQRHPQKKHHLYGKRFFHENSPTTGGSNLTQGNPSIGGPPVGVPLVGGYAPHYPPAPIENTTMNPSEMKYSCSMDFRTPDVTGNNLDHVQHNHTYHLSSDGPSGMGRPIKDKKGRRTEQEKNLTRDEKKARLLSLPITCEDIINLPMDEFNERISKFDLSEAQLSLIRDIRRRGKNKVAAQNCRKRKLDQIVHLAEEVKVIQYRKTELRSQMDHLTSERARVKHKFSILYRHIFQSLRDADGNPYSPHDFSLQQSADGSILLVPRSSAHQSMDSMSKNRNTKKDPSP